MASERQSTRRMRQLRQDFYQQGRTLDAAGDPTADCWICKKRIDYTAKPGSTDQSHELDHFYPVSLYPDLQHDPANFRHAHRRCNRERGNGQPKRDLGEVIPDWW